jgi:hypothetical protein
MDAHGTEGLLQVSLPGFPTVLDQRVLDTTKELSEFPFTEEMNSGTTLGLGKHCVSNMFCEVTDVIV